MCKGSDLVFPYSISFFIKKEREKKLFPCPWKPIPLIRVETLYIQGNFLTHVIDC